MTSSNNPTAISLSVLLLLSGCGDPQPLAVSPDGGPPQLEPLTSDGGETEDGGTEVRFARDVLPILARSCNGYCHTPGFQPMALQGAEAYPNLVNAPSTCADGRVRVKPGEDSTQSYLMAKLTGVDLCSGTAMPPSGQLPAQDLEVIRAWIQSGAPHN